MVHRHEEPAKKYVLLQVLAMLLANIQKTYPPTPLRVEARTPEFHIHFHITFYSQLVDFKLQREIQFSSVKITFRFELSKVDVLYIYIYII